MTNDYWHLADIEADSEHVRYWRVKADIRSPRRVSANDPKADIPHHAWQVLFGRENAVSFDPAHSASAEDHPSKANKSRPDGERDW